MLSNLLYSCSTKKVLREVYFILLSTGTNKNKTRWTHPWQKSMVFPFSKSRLLPDLLLIDTGDSPYYVERKPSALQLRHFQRLNY